MAIWFYFQQSPVCFVIASVTDLPDVQGHPGGVILRVGGPGHQEEDHLEDTGEVHHPGAGHQEEGVHLLVDGTGGHPLQGDGRLLRKRDPHREGNVIPLIL